MKQKPNYGFPLYQVFIRVLFAIIISLCLILLTATQGLTVIIVLTCVLIIAVFAIFGVKLFKKNFLEYRKQLLKKMIDLADIKGDEIVLDLGTGGGFLAIGFANFLKNGKIYGVDRYNIKYDSLRSKLFDKIKINFIGNTLKNAKKNAEIENQEKKCEFISADLTKPFDFDDNCFDIILSSQFLYCLSPQKRKSVLKEIDRVLKKGGKIIFFESTSFMSWDINEIKQFLENARYNLDIIPFVKFKRCSILYGFKA